MSLRLFTLGELRLSGPHGDLLPGRRMELAVLTYLARRAGQRVGRAELAACFWGERDEARARQSLRHALLKLRRTVGEGLEVTPQSVRLQEGAVELDAAAFESDLVRGRLREAVARWRGGFLAPVESIGGEQFRLWQEAERERLRRRMLRALQQLVEQALGGAEWSEAVQWARRWAEVDPLEEEAHARLIEALRLSGRSEEAREVYGEFRQRLRRELGSEPSTGFAALAEEPLAPGRGVIPEQAGRGSAALFTPDLVGRKAELAALTTAWRQVRTGSSRVLVVEGGEGMGKTRLCEEFLRAATRSAAEALILRARAYAGEQETAWSAARDLLGGLGEAPGLAGAADDALAELGRLVPAIRTRFPRLPDPRGTEPALHDAVRRVLQDVAAEVPVILFLDDAGLADVATWRLLLALARHAPPGVLLLLAARTEESGTQGRLGDLHEIPSVQRLSLHPLRAAEVSTLLASMFHSPLEQLDDLSARVHAETEGNPFHIVALVSALADVGHIGPDEHGVWRISPHLARDPLPLPESVRDAVRARLDRLDQGARQVLDAAAVLGRRMDATLLERVAECGDFASALDELISRRLLRESPRPAGSFEFSHEVIRRVAYELLGPGRRQALHRAAAAALRRSGARSSELRAVLRHHRERGGLGSRGQVRSRSGAVAALLSTLLLLAGLAAVSFSRRASPPVSPTTFAVLPFSVLGSDEYDYLREGMVDMLSTRLDGAGELSAVDPRALLAHLRRSDASVFDPADARQTAQHFGAGLYVLGSVTIAGGRLQLSAALYDASGKLKATAQTEAADESRFFDLLDELAVELLADRYRSPADGLTGAALHTTSSFPALKAYLEGERHLRAGGFLPAVHAYERATVLDSTFALAYYRLSVASEWAATAAPVLDATAAAERHSGRLSPRSRRLVQALLSSRRGEASRAEALYREIVTLHPDDVEAWLQLGEVLFHYNPLRGRGIAESREAWERVLAYEPENPVALMHLARVAAVEEDGADLDSYLERIQSAVPATDRRVMEVAALRALAAADRAGEEAVIAWLRRHNDARLTIPLLHVMTFSRNLQGAQRLLAVATAPALSPPHRAWAHLHLVYLALGQGRWRAAQAALATLAGYDPQAALIHRAFLASLPFVPTSTAEVLSLRAELLRLQEERGAWDRQSVIPFFHGLYPVPHVGEYLVGSLSLAAGDSAETLRRIAALERLAQGSSEEAVLAGDLALGLRARTAREQGQPGAALALLEQAQMQATRGGAAESPFHARAAERYLRAELLREQGRYDEALGWYASLGELSPFEVALLAPAQLRRGEIHERLGEREKALHHYRHFLALWRDADPELQPRLREVEGRVRRLSGSSLPR